MIKSGFVLLTLLTLRATAQPEDGANSRSGTTSHLFRTRHEDPNQVIDPQRFARQFLHRTPIEQDISAPSAEFSPREITKRCNPTAAKEKSSLLDSTDSLYRLIDLLNEERNAQRSLNRRRSHAFPYPRSINNPEDDFEDPITPSTDPENTDEEYVGDNLQLSDVDPAYGSALEKKSRPRQCDQKKMICYCQEEDCLNSGKGLVRMPLPKQPLATRKNKSQRKTMLKGRAKSTRTSYPKDQDEAYRALPIFLPIPRGTQQANGLSALRYLPIHEIPRPTDLSAVRQPVKYDIPFALSHPDRPGYLVGSVQLMSQDRQRADSIAQARRKCPGSKGKSNNKYAAGERNLAAKEKQDGAIYSAAKQTIVEEDPSMKDDPNRDTDSVHGIVGAANIYEDSEKPKDDSDDVREVTYSNDNNDRADEEANRETISPETKTERNSYAVYGGWNEEVTEGGNDGKCGSTSCYEVSEPSADSVNLPKSPYTEWTTRKTNYAEDYTERSTQSDVEQSTEYDSKKSYGDVDEQKSENEYAKSPGRSGEYVGMNIEVPGNDGYQGSDGDSIQVTQETYSTTEQSDIREITNAYSTSKAYESETNPPETEADGNKIANYADSSVTDSTDQERTYPSEPRATNSAAESQLIYGRKITEDESSPSTIDKETTYSKSSDENNESPNYVASSNKKSSQICDTEIKNDMTSADAVEDSCVSYDSALMQNLIKKVINDIALNRSRETIKDIMEIRKLEENLHADIINTPNLKTIILSPPMQNTILNRVRGHMSKIPGAPRKRLPAELIRKSLHNVMNVVPSSVKEIPQVTVEEHQLDHGMWTSRMVTLVPQNYWNKPAKASSPLRNRVTHFLKHPTSNARAQNHPVLKNLIAEMMRNEENAESISDLAVNKFLDEILRNKQAVNDGTNEFPTDSELGSVREASIADKWGPTTEVNVIERNKDEDARIVGSSNQNENKEEVQEVTKLHENVTSKIPSRNLDSRLTTSANVNSVGFITTEAPGKEKNGIRTIQTAPINYPRNDQDVERSRTYSSTLKNLPVDEVRTTTAFPTTLRNFDYKSTMPANVASGRLDTVKTPEDQNEGVRTVQTAPINHPRNDEFFEYPQTYSSTLKNLPLDEKLRVTTEFPTTLRNFDYKSTMSANVLSATLNTMKTPEDENGVRTIQTAPINYPRNDEDIERSRTYSSILKNLPDNKETHVTTALPTTLRNFDYKSTMPAHVDATKLYTMKASEHENEGIRTVQTAPINYPRNDEFFEYSQTYSSTLKNLLDDEKLRVTTALPTTLRNFDYKSTMPANVDSTKLYTMKPPEHKNEGMRTVQTAPINYPRDDQYPSIYSPTTENVNIKASKTVENRKEIDSTTMIPKTLRNFGYDSTTSANSDLVKLSAIEPSDNEEEEIKTIQTAPINYPHHSETFKYPQTYSSITDNISTMTPKNVPNEQNAHSAYSPNFSSKSTTSANADAINWSTAKTPYNEGEKVQTIQTTPIKYYSPTGRLLEYIKSHSSRPETGDTEVPETPQTPSAAPWDATNLRYVTTESARTVFEAKTLANEVAQSETTLGKEKSRPFPNSAQTSGNAGYGKETSEVPSDYVGAEEASVFPADSIAGGSRHWTTTKTTERNWDDRDEEKLRGNERSDKTEPSPVQGYQQRFTTVDYGTHEDVKNKQTPETDDIVENQPKTNENVFKYTTDSENGYYKSSTEGINGKNALKEDEILTKTEPSPVQGYQQRFTTVDYGTSEDVKNKQTPEIDDIVENQPKTNENALKYTTDSENGYYKSSTEGINGKNALKEDEILAKTEPSPVQGYQQRFTTVDYGTSEFAKNKQTPETDDIVGSQPETNENAFKYTTDSENGYYKSSTEGINGKNALKEDEILAKTEPSPVQGYQQRFTTVDYGTHEDAKNKQTPETDDIVENQPKTNENAFKYTTDSENGYYKSSTEGINGKNALKEGEILAKTEPSPVQGYQQRFTTVDYGTHEDAKNKQTPEIDDIVENQPKTNENVFKYTTDSENGYYKSSTEGTNDKNALEGDEILAKTELIPAQGYQQRFTTVDYGTSEDAKNKQTPETDDIVGSQPNMNENVYYKNPSTEDANERRATTSGGMTVKTQLKKNEERGTMAADEESVVRGTTPISSEIWNREQLIYDERNKYAQTPSARAEYEASMKTHPSTIPHYQERLTTVFYTPAERVPDGINLNVDKVETEEPNTPYMKKKVYEAESENVYYTTPSVGKAKLADTKLLEEEEASEKPEERGSTQTGRVSEDDEESATVVIKNFTPSSGSTAAPREETVPVSVYGERITEMSNAMTPRYENMATTYESKFSEKETEEEKLPNSYYVTTERTREMVENYSAAGSGVETEKPEIFYYTSWPYGETQVPLASLSSRKESRPRVEETMSTERRLTEEKGTNAEDAQNSTPIFGTEKSVEETSRTSMNYNEMYKDAPMVGRSQYEVARETSSSEPGTDYKVTIYQMSPTYEGGNEMRVTENAQEAKSETEPGEGMTQTERIISEEEKMKTETIESSTPFIESKMLAEEQTVEPIINEETNSQTVTTDRSDNKYSTGVQEPEITKTGEKLPIIYYSPSEKAYKIVQTYPSSVSNEKTEEKQISYYTSSPYEKTQIPLETLSSRNDDQAEMEENAQTERLLTGEKETSTESMQSFTSSFGTETSIEDGTSMNYNKMYKDAPMVGRSQLEVTERTLSSEPETNDKVTVGSTPTEEIWENRASEKVQTEIAQSSTVATQYKTYESTHHTTPICEIKNEIRVTENPQEDKTKMEPEEGITQTERITTEEEKMKPEVIESSTPFMESKISAEEQAVQPIITEEKISQTVTTDRSSNNDLSKVRESEVTKADTLPIVYYSPTERAFKIAENPVTNTVKPVTETTKNLSYTIRKMVDEVNAANAHRTTEEIKPIVETSKSIQQRTEKPSINDDKITDSILAQTQLTTKNNDYNTPTTKIPHSIHHATRIQTDETPATIYSTTEQTFKSADHERTENTENPTDDTPDYDRLYTNPSFEKADSAYGNEAAEAASKAGEIPQIQTFLPVADETREKFEHSVSTSQRTPHDSLKEETNAITSAGIHEESTISSSSTERNPSTVGQKIPGTKNELPNFGLNKGEEKGTETRPEVAEIRPNEGDLTADDEGRTQKVRIENTTPIMRISTSIDERSRVSSIYNEAVVGSILTRTSASNAYSSTTEQNARPEERNVEVDGEKKVYDTSSDNAYQKSPPAQQANRPRTIISEDKQPAETKPETESEAYATPDRTTSSFSENSISTRYEDSNRDQAIKKTTDSPIVSETRSPESSREPNEFFSSNSQTTEQNFGYFGRISLADEQKPPRELSELESSDLYYIGDGVKLPLEIKKLKDGSYALSISSKVCGNFVKKECPCCVPFEGDVVRTKKNVRGKRSPLSNFDSATPVAMFARRYNLVLRADDEDYQGQGVSSGSELPEGSDGEENEELNGRSPFEASGSAEANSGEENLEEDLTAFGYDVNNPLLGRSRFAKKMRDERERNVDERSDTARYADRIDVMRNFLLWLKNLVLSSE